ncbi:MAG TPA: hypothetical protein VN715_18825 [Roseiarcus sp.]|nr:hypothetical protein [Roseiarcus sp.]
MTVEDNLKVADSHLKQVDANVAIEVALNGFPELRERLQARSGILSGGQQQMVVLTQAIIAKPRYLLAGELSSGLAPVIGALSVLQKLAAAGVGVMLIEQFTQIALKIADAAYVMERRRICFSGKSQEFARTPALLHSAYLA